MKKPFKDWFKITMAWLILSGCAAESIKDHTAYGDEGKFGAVAVHTLFTQIPPAHIGKADWDQMRIGMVCFNGADVNEMQKVIDDLCTKQTGACSYEAYQNAKIAMATLFRHMVVNSINYE